MNHVVELTNFAPLLLAEPGKNSTKEVASTLSLIKMHTNLIQYIYHIIKVKLYKIIILIAGE